MEILTAVIGFIGVLGTGSSPACPDTSGSGPQQ
jgi:hypothetical protein